MFAKGTKNSLNAQVTNKLYPMVSILFFILLPFHILTLNFN